MRIARIATDGAVFVARVEEDKVLPIFADRGKPGHDPLREMLSNQDDVLAAPPISPTLELSECRLLSPVRDPQKILAIGLNYADHARESGQDPPKAPVVFAKMPNSIIGPGEAIRWRSQDSRQVDYEAELAVVIGRRAQQISAEEALSFVFGYTCCNDVSARDAQFADGQWVRGKSFDTFCPIGPWIVTADEISDPQALPIRCLVDGRVLQDSTTAEMIFGVAELVSYISQTVTLEPGDVIATGTPFGVGFARKPPIFLENGNLVQVEIDGIGTLPNPVIVE